MSTAVPREPALRAICVGLFLLPALAHGLYQPRHLFDFVKRDSCDTATLDSSCTTSLTECVDAICAACADVPSIESCCQLSTVDDISNCIITDSDSSTAPSVPSTTAAPAITPSPSSASGGGTDADSMACNNFESMLTSCEVQTPHFTDLQFSNQASCLCYTSNVWNPQVYDGYWSACLGYLSTATPAGYSSVVNDNGFYIDPCQEAGDVAQPASATAFTTSGVSSPHTISEPGLPVATSQTTPHAGPSVVTVTGTAPTSTANSSSGRNNLEIHQALLALMVPVALVL